MAGDKHRRVQPVPSGPNVSHVKRHLSEDYRIYERHNGVSLNMAPAHKRAGVQASHIGKQLREMGRHAEAIEWHDLDVWHQRQRDGNDPGTLDEERGAWCLLGECRRALAAKELDQGADGGARALRQYARASRAYSEQLSCATRAGTLPKQRQALENLAECALDEEAAHARLDDARQLEERSGGSKAADALAEELESVRTDRRREWLRHRAAHLFGRALHLCRSGALVSGEERRRPADVQGRLLERLATASERDEPSAALGYVLRGLELPLAPRWKALLLYTTGRILHEQFRHYARAPVRVRDEVAAAAGGGVGGGGGGVLSRSSGGRTFSA